MGAKDRNDEQDLFLVHLHDTMFFTVANEDAKILVLASDMQIKTASLSSFSHALSFYCSMKTALPVYLELQYRAICLTAFNSPEPIPFDDFLSSWLEKTATFVKES